MANCKGKYYKKKRSLIVFLKTFFKPTKFFVYKDNFVITNHKLYYNSTLDNEKIEFAKIQDILKRLKNNSDPRSAKSREKAKNKQTQRVILVHLYH